MTPTLSQDPDIETATNMSQPFRVAVTRPPQVVHRLAAQAGSTINEG